MCWAVSVRTLRRAHDVRRRHVHSYLACMHTFFWFSNLHLTNLVCRGPDFVEFVLVNFKWAKSTLSLRYVFLVLVVC